jgi:hypothetical protein
LTGLVRLAVRHPALLVPAAHLFHGNGEIINC